MARAARLKPYLWAILSIIGCSGLRILIGAAVPVESTSPYLFFIVAVVVVAYNGGFWPGVVTVLLATMTAELGFTPYAVITPGQSWWTRAGTFDIQALVICYICGVRIKTALDRTAALEAEREARTELATTSQALYSSEERYRSAIEAIPQIVFVADTTFRFEWINDRWSGLTGLSGDAALGFGWIQAVEIDDRANVRETVSEVVHEPKVINAELRLKEQRTRSTRWHLMRAVPVRGISGQVTQWIGSFTDIHDSKEIMHNVVQLNEELEARVQSRTEELEGANRELQVANSELESFCYAVSHDLRTPLRAVDGFSKALLEDYGEALPEEGKEYIDRVRSGARRMDELITALLKLSRVARQEMAVQPVDLTEIASAAWDDMRHERGSRKVEFSVEEDLTALGDPRLVRIVFDNLLGNALKFTAGRETAKVEVGHSQTTRGDVFFVRDNGVGFSMEYVGKLFAPFERLHSPRDYPGSGIGLATVMRSVRKHGGDAWANSSEGEGATFHFTLASPP